MNHEMTERKKSVKLTQKAFLVLNEEYLGQGGELSTLRSISVTSTKKTHENIAYISHFIYSKKILAALLLVPIFYGVLGKDSLYEFIQRYAQGTRCLVPNNYLTWEFTRPVSNCDFCRGVDSALYLRNISKEEFSRYAYSSRPMVVQGAASHWPAKRVFSLHFFKNLYESIEGAYESVEEECQFLHFKSDFANLREVFAMSERRAINLGEDPWYVGWKNCHPQVLEIMKRFYHVPHFLPDDAEIPQTNYVFLGYDQGAVMHLDYIPRLMWQAQILGSKTWTVAPTPECDRVCRKFDFSVGSGDILLLDTRIWYHGTYVENGHLSLTITSEYG
ncbi:uncharacterized protein LOC107267143 [Cephus cinctus]|uniref:Uncharacterized protein LOC107267143 n=1 Tax=Cephus cinctus TaxID=211228 RepID=A0AAJ7FIU5_CEPCN|nr:uncharacterized protein LOC107267143 [Cephus cinctus]